MSGVTASRIRALQERLSDSDVDLVVLNPSPSFTYLTGHHFDSHERLFLLLVPASGDPVAVVPALEAGNWRSSVPEVDGFHTWDDKDGPGAAAEAAFSGFRSARRVGVEPIGMRVMEVRVVETQLPDAEVVECDAVLALRLSKNAEEAAAMRRAAEIAEASLEAVLAELEPGQTEREIAGRLSAQLLLRGGEGISFGPIVLGGPQSALPHGVPGDRPIARGEFLLVDWGTSYHGYHSDITRTFVVGEEPSDRLRDVYETVLAGNRAGIAAAKTGVTSHEVNAAAQAPLQAERFAEFMTHRTGHGLGLDIHEPPSVMEGNHDPLVEGTVITVEPGLYLEGFGGVRIEDDVWVKANAGECLSSMDKALRIVGG